MRIFALVLFFSLLAIRVLATPLSPAARTEVEALLAQLQVSGCEFGRNGTWYSAADAKTHLLRKLEHLESKNMVQTAEQFVELGASKSSLSGQPYLVKCVGRPTVDSQVWLMGKLMVLRTQAR